VIGFVSVCLYAVATYEVECLFRLLSLTQNHYECVSVAGTQKLLVTPWSTLSSHIREV